MSAQQAQDATRKGIEKRELVDKKQKVKPSEFAVRLQAQGGGVQESVAINQDTPITVAQGLAGLEQLKATLSKRELELRRPLFERAERFIVNAGKTGLGAGPPGLSFPIHKTNPIRVDVEIWRGVNFKN
jgi:hypothetical protein